MLLLGAAPGGAIPGITRFWGTYLAGTELVGLWLVFTFPTGTTSLSIKLLKFPVDPGGRYGAAFVTAGAVGAVNIKLQFIE